MSLSKGCLATFLLLAAWSVNADEPLRVSLIVSDSATRSTINLAREMVAEYSQLKATRIKVYSVTRLQDQDLDHLRKSDLAIMLFMGRTAIATLKDDIIETIRQGGRVYGFGPSFNEDDAALGIVNDPELRRYFEIGGVNNIRNGLLYAIAKTGKTLSFASPQDVLKVGLYESEGKGLYGDFESFKQNYRHYDLKRPWVGFLVYQDDVVSGDTKFIDAMIKELEQRGFNVLTAFGYPNEKPVKDFFFDERGNGRVEAVVASTMKIGINPDIVLSVLEKLDVPVLNAITPYAMTRAEWEASPVGLDIMERSWQLFLPEMAGLIQPTIVASKELVKDPESGVSYMEEQPIMDGVNILARRVQRWVALRLKPNRDKRILLQVFNFPPGKGTIGASYLNVVPESLWQVMKRMEHEGYSLSGMPDEKQVLQDEVVRYASNIPIWNHDDIDELARSGKPVLFPVETYKKWFVALPKSSQDAIIKSWGLPEVNTMMSYIDDMGKRYFVFPVLRYGNVIVAPQPSKGWTENPEKLFHDMNFPPSHQYVAFYLWLRHEFKADAMVQFGTHGTLEWLPGKEAGLSADNPPEYLVADLPNLYPYIVDDPGEGTQAKRRGNAVMISHMTPPFDKAGLNPELRELKAQISDYQAALQKSPLLAETHLDSINGLAQRMGIFKDLDMGHLEEFHGDMEHPEHEHDHAAHDFSQDPTPELVDKLLHYLEEISDKPTPFGLHTLGVVPQEKFIQSTAEAIVSLDITLNDQQRKDRIEEVKNLIHLSAKRELDALVAGLSGRFITVGPGGDPIRRLDTLPTGRNFYVFDPRRIPSVTTYGTGVKLARELIEVYKSKHGEYPDKLTYNLWGLETIRHEGTMESQIMYLMGVRPVWDTRGVVTGVEAIPRAELGRARIDVNLVPSGLFRDMFPNLMVLLDKAATLAQAQDEGDNALRNNMIKTRAMLEARGIESELARRMAAVRLFSVPSGSYGTNVNMVADRSDTWEEEKQVADVYFMRMSHLYGQGFWADTGSGSGQAGLARDLFRNALSGTKVAVHSRSSNVYQTLDNDDFFQYLGGTAMAVRAVDGVSPEVYVTNQSDPANVRQETLEKMMGREMRTRYTNPVWIKAMQKEGYAGAKFINEGVQNLWGWQVTVPEAVDAAKWNEIYETYVKDRYDLDMEQFFRGAGNLWAYQELMTRMLETVRKGYWKPDEATIRDLGHRVSELIEELKLKCTEEDCHDPVLTKLVQAHLVPVPVPSMVVMDSVPASLSTGQVSASSAPAPASTQQTQTQQVQGYEMEETSRSSVAVMVPVTPWTQILGFLLLCVTLWWGFRHAYRWSYRIKA